MSILPALSFWNAPTMITCGIPGLTRGSIDIDDIIIKCLSVMLDINSF
jgi:hypothetical protein